MSLSASPKRKRNMDSSAPDSNVLGADVTKEATFLVDSPETLGETAKVLDEPTPVNVPGFEDVYLSPSPSQARKIAVSRIRMHLAKKSSEVNSKDSVHANEAVKAREVASARARKVAMERLNKAKELSAHKQSCQKRSEDAKSTKKLSVGMVKNGSSLRASGTPQQCMPIPNLGCTPLPRNSESMSKNAKNVGTCEGSPESAAMLTKTTPVMTPSSVFATPFSPTTDSFMKYVNESAPDTDEREMSMDGILNDDNSSCEPKGEDLMACMEEEVETIDANEEEFETVANKEEENADGVEPLHPHEPPSVVEFERELPDDVDDAENAAILPTSPAKVTAPLQATTLMPSSSSHAKAAFNTLALATLCTFGVVTLTLTGLAYVMYNEPPPAFESFPSSI